MIIRCSSNSVHKFLLTGGRLLFMGLWLCLMSCQDDTAYHLNVPKHFPTPIIPDDNLLTTPRVELGKRLFFEKRLSLDSSIACVSCHQPQYAFADNQRFSLGVNDSVGVRNATSLTNVAYEKTFFKDGGVTRLETQVLTPIHDSKEMAFDLSKVVERLSQVKTYQQLSHAAYGKPLSRDVIVKALATFERTLISGNSPYDQYIYQKDQTALSQSALRGMALFFSERTNCSKCHNGFNFTNFTFQNNGLYSKYEDRGRERISLKKGDRAKFKVPTLRNVALTAPYMHDGGLLTLDAVIAHYNKGGQPHPNKNQLIQPLNLDEQAQKDLVHFLEALTDKEFSSGRTL